ncbi:MAG TPA: hypothetical protein VFU60_20315 [Ktedonobacterales bacterium]|nr:hypothetical protein [Ktedonobacterales bacterium]
MELTKTLRRIVLGVLALACALLIVVFIVLPLVGPFSSVAVPANCTIQTSHLPASRDYAVPGVGTGAMLVENANVAVVVLANYGQTPFYTHVYIVNRHTNQIANAVEFPTNVVDAGFDGDTLYLFNDTLGYFVSAVNGQPISDIVTNDNYRGLYEPNRVQTDLTISGITSSHTLFFRHHIPMANIVRGCYLT